MIRFQCPTCAKILKTAEEHTGGRVSCPKCGAHIIVPPPVRREAVLGKAIPDPAPEVAEEPEPVPPPLETANAPRSAGYRERGQGEKYCHECGAVIRSKAVVCPQCGVSQGGGAGSFSTLDLPAKPGKVTAVGVILIVAGAVAVLGGLILASTFFLLCWPGTYYAFFVGVWTIIEGCMVLGQQAGNSRPPKVSCVLHIINIINGNIVSLILGIIGLVLLSDQEVKDWYYGQTWA